MSEMPVLEMLVKNIYFGDNNVYRTCALRKIEEKKLIQKPSLFLPQLPKQAHFSSARPLRTLCSSWRTNIKCHFGWFVQVKISTKKSQKIYNKICENFRLRKVARAEIQVF